MATLRPAVQGLDNSQLRAMCVDLAERVRDFDPDVVVGIATGGAGVALEVAQALGTGASVLIVKSQRPGTRIKQGRLASSAIKSLPRRLADVARLLEVEYRELRYYVRLSANGPDQPVRESRIEGLDALVQGLLGAARVLVVDDTLDSGETLSGVLRATRAADPVAEVRSAVLATTWRRPPVTADYVLHPRLLLRLPSSFDA
jgi:hypoxanthine phosphoribosyltransferase